MLAALEESTKNMCKILTPNKYSPNSSNHEEVIKFQQKNFKDITAKLDEVNFLLSNKYRGVRFA